MDKPMSYLKVYWFSIFKELASEAGQAWSFMEQCLLKESIERQIWRTFFKRVPRPGGGEPGICWFFAYFLSLKQRLWPHGYCATLHQRTLYGSLCVHLI